MKRILSHLCSVILIYYLPGSILLSPSAFSQENGRPKGIPNPDSLVDSRFQDAYAKFDAKDYPTALRQFQEYIELDTGLVNYDSYGFLAECYRLMGNTDSGMAEYSKGVDRAAAILWRYRNQGVAIGVNDSASKMLESIREDQIAMSEIRFDSLYKWKARYPEFPDCLRKESGFVPYEELPIPIHQEAPEFPLSGRTSSSSGLWTSVLQAKVDKNGNPADINVLTSGGTDFDIASIRAFRKWTFKPPKHMGRYVMVKVVVPFSFRLGK